MVGLLREAERRAAPEGGREGEREGGRARAIKCEVKALKPSQPNE